MTQQELAEVTAAKANRMLDQKDAELEALRTKLAAAEARVTWLEDTGKALYTECNQLGNADNWDTVPESLVLALSKFKQALTNDPCDYAAGYAELHTEEGQAAFKAAFKD